MHQIVVHSCSNSLFTIMFCFICQTSHLLLSTPLLANVFQNLLCSRDTGVGESMEKTSLLMELSFQWVQKDVTLNE